MLKKLMKTRFTQKVLSLLLATAIILSVLPTAIYSDDTLPEGTGTEDVTTDSGESEEASDSETTTTSPNEETGNEDETTTDTVDESTQGSSEPEYSENVSSEIQKISMTQTAADTVSATVSFTDDLPYASYYELFLDGVLVSVFNFQQEQKVGNLTAGKKYTVQIKGYDGAGNVLADSGNYDIFTSIDSNYVLNENATVYSASLSRGLNLNGCSLTILNDLSLTGGTLNIGGGSLYVKGDFNYHNGSSVSSGYLQMQNTDDYVLVDGDFNVANSNDIESFMTAGTLEIKGDFTQAYSTYVYKPSGTHKTIFSGNNEQTITLPNHSSRFNILELKNTSGVIFGSEIQYNELIANDTVISYETADPVIYDWILEKDETIDGDYNILSENIDLNGHTLTINGDLIQAGGILKINGGKLNVSGDYRMQNERSGYDNPSNGILNMTKNIDYVMVGGNFISYSTVSHEGLLTAGTLEVKGDLRHYSGSDTNIYTSGTHTIILSGEKDQQLDISYYSQINNLKIIGTSKRYIDNQYGTFKIAGEVNIDENSMFTNPDNIDFLPSAKLNTAIWNGNLNLDYPIEIMQDMKIEGYVNVYNNNSTVKKWTLTHSIEADKYIYISGSSVDIEIIDGDIIAGEYVNIYSKDFKSNSDIIAQGNINISVSGEVCEIDGDIKTTDYINVYTSSSVTKDFKLSGNIEASKYIYISTYNADGIINANMSSDSYISVSGNNANLSGDEIKSEDYINLSGTDIEVNTKNISAENYISISGTNSLIGSENLTGELRLGSTETVLTADVAITGNVLINSGTLNPNGNKLSVSGDLTAQSGRLQMQNAEDYILVSCDFNSKYTNASGQITAGVLEIKGDFVQDSINYAFVASGTHKTVFSGEEAQTVTLECLSSALNIIEITNTSESGVDFTTAVRYSELIDENDKAHFNEAAQLNRTLTANETIQGDFSFTGGELNLSGFTLTVNGDLIHSGGTINIGSGKLVVNGDYRVETPNEDGSFSQSKGILKMSDETGLVDVNGGFIYNSVYYSYSNITAGTIQVDGNVKLTNFSIYGSANHTFELTGTAKQTISGSGIYFDDFKINNTSSEGIGISTAVYVRGTLYNTDTPISNSSKIYLYGGTVDGGVWNYDLTLNSSVSYGNLHIKGDVYGYIYMTNPDDYLIIDGDINFSSSSTLTNGVLEVKGDILQGSSTYLTFIASNNHKTILSGDKLQTVNISNANSAFNILEIKNYSDDGVVFTKNVKIGELITNDCKVNIPETEEETNIIEKNLTLDKDWVITGDLYLNAGTLNLNGFSLTVTGNIIHSGGTMNINGGMLNVNGSYRLQSEKLNTYTSSTGILQMQNASDTINITGSFIVQSTVQSYLTAGTLNIGGNIEQLYGYQYSLTASGSHTTVLNGSSVQSISIYYPTYSILRNLAIENSSEAGVTFQTNVYVSGEFTDNAYKLKNPNYLVISGGIYNPTEYNGHLTVTSNFTLGTDLTIKGNLIVNGGTLNQNGHKLTVTGNYTQSSGNLTLGGDMTVEGNASITQGVLSLNGHKLTINGSLTNNTSKVYNSSSRIYTYYSGYIKMTDTDDYLFVGGNFSAITINNTQNYYTAGTLEVKGNFTQGYYTSYGSNKYGFYASGTHRVILSGEALQTVRFDNTESKFCILEIKNTSDDGVVFSTPVNYSRIITNDNKVAFYNNMRSGWTLTGDEIIDTDLNLGSGVLNLNGHTLTINGSLNQYAGKVNINGGKLIINGDYLIQNLFETSNTVSSGILSMIKPADVVSVSGDFVMHSSVSHKYYLTAGTLEIGGDFIEKSGGSTSDFFASGTHKVVLNGDTAQTVNLTNYSNCAINSLTLQNTSAEGITFANTVYVTGELINDNSILNSSEKIYIASSASLPDSEWKDNLTIANRTDFPGVFVLEKPLTIDGTLTIYGDFTTNKPLVVNGNLNYYDGNTTVNDGIYVKGDTKISSSSQGNQVFKLNSEMNIDGNLDINGGILFVNGQTLNIGGNLSIGYKTENSDYFSFGYLKMTNGSDRVFVSGDFNMYTYVGSNGFLTNGVLDIKGDFLQYTNDNATSGFYATGNHRTILSGDRLQNVVFDSAKSKFNILEIKNYSEDGVLINNSISYSELITNGCKVTYSGDERIGWKLTSNEIIDGDLNLTAGTLDLNGFTLTVTGNLIQSGGTIYVNGGTLDIAGDFRIQKKTGESFGTSVGILKMTNPDDTLEIGGGFTTQSQESHEGYLTAGKMYVAGDFTQLSPSSNGGNRNPDYDHSFYPTGSHTVILNGTETQNVSLYFSNSYRYRSNGDYDYFARFENLSIENTSTTGVNFSKALRVYGEISNRSSKLQNLSNLYFTSSTAVAGGIWADDLYINDNMTLGSDLEVTGDLYLNDNMNLNAHTLSVCGNVIHKSGTLTIGRGKLYIDGNYENNYSQNGSNGITSMVNIDDYMLVGGNYYLQTYYNNNSFTAGILEIRGNVDFRYYNSSYANPFTASGSHKTLLSGENVQSVYIQGTSSTFNVLEITKDFDTGYSFTNLRYNELIEATPDIELPIIRSISVPKKYITGYTSVSVSASDNSSVKSITLQYSPDGEVWTDYTTVDNINRSSVSKDFAFQNTIDGTYFIRAVTADSKGNISDVDISPYETVIIDKVKPETPYDVTSDVTGGRIKVAWKYDTEGNDTAYFRVYRKTAATSYTLYKDNYTYTDLSDFSFNTGITYTYKIAAVDLSGNESIHSAEVSEIIISDYTPPEILSVSPKTGSVLKASDELSISCYDNLSLKTLTVTYKKSSDSDWLPLKEISLDSYHKIIDVDIDRTSFENGLYEFKIVLIDTYDNTSNEKIITYEFNKGSLSKPGVTAEGKGYRVELTWDMDNTANLLGYNIYKKSPGQNAFSILASTTSSNYADGYVTPGLTYVYKIEAIDSFENAVMSDIVNVVPTNEDDVAPIADAGNDIIGIVGKALSFDGSDSRDNHNAIDKYEWDFGDGESGTGSAVSHEYEKSGTYTAILTVTDSAGNSSTDTITVLIYSNDYFELTISTVDENGRAIDGVEIICDEIFGSGISIRTDSSGNVILPIRKGSYDFIFFANGYIAKSEKITVNDDTLVTVTLEKGETVSGEFVVSDKEMSFEEIISAGIDTSDPANQHITKSVVKVQYDSKEKQLTIYRNTEGELIIVGSDDAGTFEEYRINGKLAFSSANNNISIGDGWMVIPSKSASTLYEGEEIEHIAMMRVTTEVAFAKEFYKAEIMIINNADSNLTITEANVTLNLPNGLSVGGTGEATIDLGDISGGSFAEATWIVRGDKAGTYSGISAYFTGILNSTSKRINVTFNSDQNITILGGNALRFEMVHDLWSPTNDVWQIDYKLTNISEKTVNDIKIDIFCDEIQNANVDRIEIYSDENMYPVVIRYEGDEFNIEEAEWWFNPLIEDIRVTAFNLEPNEYIEFTVFINKTPPPED